jgi:hypothetical protein
LPPPSTQWPTATAGDAKASGSRGKLGNDGNHAHEGSSLTDVAVRNWATPLARDSRGPTKGKNAQGSECLSQQTKNWATPCSRDHKGRHSGKWGKGARCLPEDARSLPLPTTCTHGGECKWTLNPLFVEKLMGFPPGYTALEP